MKARRSESCPRPSRKPVSGAPPQAELQALPGPLTPLLTRACTLQDLGPEDKQKVTKLLKQVVELGQEVQTLRQQRDETAKQYSQREEELKETHRQLHKEHLLLKKKLGQVLLVLRASQAKVHALEAAQQAAELPQKTQPSNDPSGQSDAAVLPRDQEAEPQAQAGLGRAVGSTATGHGQGASRPSSPAPKAASAPSLLHVAPGTHVSITIHHTSDPHAASASALQAPGPNPVIAIPTTTAAMPAATVEGQCASGHDAGPSNPDGSMCSSHSPTALHTWRTGVGAGVVAASEGCSGVTSSCCMANAGWPCVSRTSTASSSAVGAGPAGAGAGGSRARAGPRSIQVNSSMQHFEAVPVDEVLLESPTGQLGSPMIVPPSEDVVAAASSLLGWQAQQGFMSADEATSTLRPVPGPGDDAPACSAGSGAAAARGRAVGSHANVGSGNGAMARKVLSYDPAIGKNGAFYFVDVDSPPASAVLPAGRPPTHNKEGAGRVTEHAQLQGVLCTPSSATSSMTLGAGGTMQDTGTSGGAAAQPTVRPHAEPRRAVAEPASTWQPPAAQQAHGQAIPLTVRPASAGPAAIGGSSGVQEPLQSVHAADATAAVPTAKAASCPEPSFCASAAPPGSAGAAMHAGPASNLHMVALGRAMGQGHCQELQQPRPTVLQPPQSVAPFSPYSYAASDSTAAVTPLAPLHAAALALARAGAGNGRLAAGSCNSITGVKHAPHAGAGSRRAGVGFAETPGSATGSLYRMAGMLEDLARQQHWDVQPPPGVAPAQPLMPAASPKPGAAQEQQQQQAVGMAGGPQAVAAWLEENAGSASSVGGSCITDRYDESLVDILSQADEDLEQEHRQQQRQQQRLKQQQDQAAKLGRQRGQRGRPASYAHAGGQQQHGPRAAVAGIAADLPVPRPQKVSIDALLAANIFEENDVLSAILEQER